MGGNRNSWLRTLAASVAVTLLANACGGGGGGDGSQPPPVGPGDAEKFFPDTVGDTWFYDSTIGDPADPNMHHHGFGQMQVTGTKSFGSVVAKVFRTTSTDDPGYVLDTYYSKDGNGVTNHGNNDPADTLTRAIVPYLEAKFPVATGVVTDLSRSNVDYGEDLDGDQRNETVDFSLRITMDGFEAQTVPAGSFARTAKRTSKIAGTVHTTSSGSFPFSATDELWSAPGVGIVKQLTSVSAGGLADQLASVARGYKVDGVTRGMGLPTTFVAGLLVDDSVVPVVASNSDDGFMLATVRQTGTSPIASKIVAVFGDADATVVQEQDVTSTAVGYMIGRAIDAAYDGTNYLLLYYEGTSNTTPNPLRGMRISGTGAMLDAPAGGIEIDAGSVWMAAVAYGGSNYLVVYSRYDNTIGRHLLYGRLVTPAGSVAGEFPIGPRDQNELHPDVAYDGSNFLVVWQQERFSGSGTTETCIAAARVSEAGVVLDPDGIVVSNTGKVSERPRVTFGGGQYLAVWVDGRNAVDWSDGYDIYGARIATSGGLLDGPASTGGLRISGDMIANTGYPEAVYTGSEFLVAWNAGAYTGITEQSGIFGARVTADGTVNRGGSNYGIALSGEPPAAVPSVYRCPTPLRLGARHVVTWAANRDVKDVIVHTLE